MEFPPLTTLKFTSRTLVLLALFALIAINHSTHAQSTIISPAGINLQNTGTISNGKILIFPSESAITWNSPSLSGFFTPAGNFTGVMPDGTLVPRVSLLPLKPQSLTVTGEDNTTVTTLIDHQGIDTNSVITDALYLVDPTNQQPLPLATISGNVVTFPQNAAFPATGTLTLPSTLRFPSGGTLTSPFAGSLLGDGGYGNAASAYRAVVMGGSNNRASGDGSVVLGGLNYSYQENRVMGNGSVIIGASGSVVNASLSAILGGQRATILNPASSYSAIIAGGSNEMSSTAGDYNVILGGGNNRFVSGGYASAILAGQRNSITNGSYRQAIVAGDTNSIDNSVDSTILGGSGNQILGNNQAGMGGWAQNAVVAGSQNRITPNTALSVVLGGQGNEVGGWGNATLAASGARASGTNQVVMGRLNAADSTKALIIGNGNSDTSRSNGFTVDFNGNAAAAGSVTVGGVVNAASVSTTGAVQAGSFSTESANVTGSVQAGSVKTNSLIITPYASDTSDISMGSYTTP
jgi:hypothetical protein